MSAGMRMSLLRFAEEHEAQNRMGVLLCTSSCINLLAGLITTIIWFAFLVPFYRSVLHTHNVHAYIAMFCCIALLQSLSFHFMAYYRVRNQALRFMIAGILVAVLLWFQVLPSREIYV
ncbi:hypothetical protein ACFL3Q_15300, partial [Planctomycetota bacterium]